MTGMSWTPDPAGSRTVSFNTNEGSDATPPDRAVVGSATYSCRAGASSSKQSGTGVPS